MQPLIVGTRRLLTKLAPPLPPQVAFTTIDVVSADVTNHRQVGIVAVLSNDPVLYHPGAFGGAVIEDPWETLEKCVPPLTFDLKTSDFVRKWRVLNVHEGNKERGIVLSPKLFFLWTDVDRRIYTCDRFSRRV